jgi:HEAT repeat protein
MKSKKKIICILLIMATTATPRTYAQANEIANLLRDFEAMAASGTTVTFDEAEPVLERFALANKESVAAAMPAILHATSSPNVAVRRIAAMALYEITNRPEGHVLLSTETATFTALIVDSDIPIRRITGFAVANLQLNANSPLVPVLETYLAREDAVSTIGAGVATVLLKVAPNDAESTNAVVQFMRRKDQTSESRGVLLNAIRHVAKSHNREIGKEVAGYADDPDERTSVLAIETLQQMGESIMLESRQSLSRIASDIRRTPSVRTAATKALSAAQ